MKNTNAEKAEYRAMIMGHAYSIEEACDGDDEQMEQLLHEEAAAYLQVKGDIEEILSTKRLKKAMEIS